MTLQPMEVNGNAEIHLQSVDKTHSRAGSKRDSEPHGNLVLEGPGRDLQDDRGTCAGAGLLEALKPLERDAH